MMPSGASTAEFTPIFNWSPPRGRKLSLISFVVASTVLHALCFYVFQIIYPPTVALLPPPARVTLITAESEQGRVLLRWVEAEDPALSSTTQRPTDERSPQLADPAHVPSYLSREVALKQLPSFQPDLRVPSSQPPGPVPLPRPTTPAPAGIVASRLRFAAEAAFLGSPIIPSLQFSASTREPPAPAQFRVGINSHGAVSYCFLENSSGDPALDEQARRHLLLCRFPSLRQGTIPLRQLLWTTALFEWGNDIALPAATTEPPAS